MFLILGVWGEFSSRRSGGNCVLTLNSDCCRCFQFQVPVERVPAEEVEVVVF